MTTNAQICIAGHQELRAQIKGLEAQLHVGMPEWRATDGKQVVRLDEDGGAYAPAALWLTASDTLSLAKWLVEMFTEHGDD